MVTNNSANNKTGASGTVLQGQGVGTASDFSTATYPSTTTANRILYSSATNTISEIATANNSIVVTNGSGVPSLGTSLSNDFTFTKSTSGATTNLTVSNTSNTASSSANILSQVAGGTAADATYQATISGGQNWTWGLDNSDSDSFVLAASSALGTTNVFKCTTAGEITKPLQPAFLATASAQSNVTGDGTVYTVVFANEVFDQNNDFDGTSTFTAPVTGRYLFTVTLDFSGLGAANTAGNISLVTSNRTHVLVVGNWANFRNLANTARMSASVLTDMDAGDTAYVTGFIGAGTKVVGITAGSIFSGYLAC